MSAAAKKAPAAYDVIVVGGGMVGSLFACALGDSVLKVAVIEPPHEAERDEPDIDPRVSALTLATQTMFERVGAWVGIAQRRVAPVRAMRVWQAGLRRPSVPFPLPFSREPVPGAARFGEIEFDAAEIGEPCLAYIVENRVVLAALRERLAQFTNVQIVEGAVVDLSAGERAQVTLADGRSLSARLVVGADGADSGVRGRMGIPLRSMAMRQKGIVATVRTALPHDDCAWQAFLPTGPLAFLPLPEVRTCSIVWSADNRRADELLALDDKAFAAALAESFGERLGAIGSVSARAAFPLALTHADRYVRERVALIGDAAHTVHPLAGQGVNLGFLDAASLAEVLLTAAQARGDIGALHVLRRYERWRKGDNVAMIAVTGGFKYFFGNDWAALMGIRGAGLSLANRVGPFKNLIMRRACGLVGDLPAIARRADGSISTVP